MSSSALVAVFLAVSVALVCGDVTLTLNGNCPNWAPKQNVQSSRLSGNWVGVWGLRNGMDGAQHTCLRSNNQVSADGVFNTTIQFNNANNQKVTKSSIGTPVDGQNGKLAYVSTQNPQNTRTSTILETDYDNYLVIVTCKQAAGKHGYSVAFLSRQQQLSQQHLDAAKQALTAANINQDNLQQISQNNCNN